MKLYLDGIVAMEKRNSMLFLLSIFLIFLYCNYCMPMFTDDYWYTTVFGGGRRVESLSDVFASQWNHYFTHGGRTVAHSFVQSFLYFGKDYFNVCNSMVFTVLVFIIYLAAIAGKRPFIWKSWWFAAVFFGLWACIKDFGQTVFWLTGACNYLWMTTLALAFIIPYKAAFMGKRMKPSLLRGIGMFLFGILAGWTNENTGLTVLVICAGFTYFSYRNAGFCNWMAAGILGGCIGYGMMMAAPGNYARMEMFLDVTLYDRLYECVKTMTSRLFVKQLPIWLAVGTAVCYCIKQRIWKSYKRELQATAVFTAASIFNNLIMFGSPSFPGRAGFASTVFLTVAMMQGFYLCHIAGISLAGVKLKRFVQVSVSAYLLLSVAITVQEYTKVHAEEQMRIASVWEQKSRGADEILLEPFSVSGRGKLSHVYLADIYFAPTEENIWANEIFAQYYGVKSAQLKYKPAGDF